MNLKSVLFVLISLFIFEVNAQDSKLRNHSHRKVISNPNKEKVLLENKGQWPEEVLFNTQMLGGKIWFEQHKMIYHLQDYSAMHELHAMKNPSFQPVEAQQTFIKANFIGSNKVYSNEKYGKSKSHYNFFKGNDQTKWASNVHGYQNFILNEFYDGIDFKALIHNDQVKYEFIVHPNAAPDIIKINYSGQEKIYVDIDGNLILETALGKVIEKKPIAYQNIKGKKVEVSCQFIVSGSNVSFFLGNYDKQSELIIDPEIVFASYSGSLSDNFGMTATYDNQGNLYSGGIVFGNSYPVTAGSYDVNGNFNQVNAGASQGLVYGVTDIFISKYSSDGSTLLYSTYLGGGNDFGGTDVVHSLICNEQNELYLFGTTSSSDFPLVNAVQTNFNGGIYREFSSNGTHFWGNNQSQSNGGTDLIIAKFSANGSNLLASTYFGGSNNDGLNYNETGMINGNQFGGLMYNYGDPFRGEIMLDNSGNVYIASCTYSTNFPLMNPTQNTNAGNLDGVLIKFNSSITSVLWSTYWGGNGRDACYAVKFDSFGNIYTTGGTRSDNFPISSGAFMTVHSGTNQADGFISKFDVNYNLLKSTFIGTAQYDQTFFLQIDRLDKVFVLGQTRGVITPTTGKYANPNSGQFIMKFENNLENQIWQTVFGNENGLVNISPTAFLVDVCGNIYVSGWGGGIANSLQQTSPLTGMPTTPDAFQTSSGDGYNFYLIVLKSEAVGLFYATYLGGGSSQEHVDGGTSRFDEKGVVYHSACGGCGAHSDFPTGPSNVWSNTNNSANCNNLVFKFNMNAIPLADFVPDQTAGCADFSVTFDNFSTDDDTYLWDFGNGNLDSTTFEPTIIYDTPGNYTVNLYVTDSVCQLTDTAQITINVFPEVILNVDSTINLCSTNPITLTADTDGTADTFIWSTSPTFSPALNSPTDSSIIISGAGTYYIQVSNPQCSKIDTVIVTYQPPPTVSLSVTGNIGCAPFNSTFQVVSSNADSLTWDFGGQGSTSTSSLVSSQNFEFINPGIYTVLVSGINECPEPVQDSVEITILEPISINTLTPIFICNNDPYTMGATFSGQPTNVIWSDLPDFSNPLNNGPSDYDIIVTNSGTYYIQATNGYCSDTSSSSIVFNAPSQASFEPSDSAACGSLTISFNNLSVQTDYFIWDFGNGFVDSVNFEPTVSYTTPGQYTISLAILDPDCPAADTAYFTVTVVPEIQVSLNDVISLCDTVPLTINPVVTNGTATSYQWSSNNNFSDTLNQNITVPDLLITNPLSGFYYFKANNDECSTLDSILIEYVSIDIDLSANDSICLGENSTVTALNLVPSVSLNYNWTPTAIIVSSSFNEAIVNPTFSQYVYVTANGNGCSVEDSIFINVANIDPTQVIASASQYIVAPGSTVTLYGSPSGLDSYSWSPSDGISDPTMQQTNALVNETTVYTLSVTEDACTRSDTVEIRVYEIICEDPYVFIPNAFSPNGDSENDVLYVRGIWIEKMIFRIFDRWGEMVFESTDPSIGWDGTFRDRKLDPDVYDFYLDVTCIGGLKSVTKGNVTLMK